MEMVNKRFTTRPPIGTRVWYLGNDDPSDTGTVVGYDGTVGVYVRWDNGIYDLHGTAPDGKAAEIFSFRQVGAIAGGGE